jgi:hypothetical protein
MSTVCTLQLSKAIGFEPLVVIPRYFVFIALLAWLATINRSSIRFQELSRGLRKYKARSHYRYRIRCSDWTKRPSIDDGGFSCGDIYAGMAEGAETNNPRT